MTDSKQSFQLFERIDSLHSNDYPDIKPSYVSFLKDIYEAKKLLIKVDMLHVKAHQKIDAICQKLNSGADIAAKAARSRAMRQLYAEVFPPPPPPTQ